MTGKRFGSTREYRVVFSLFGGLLLFVGITAAALTFARLNIDVHHQGVMYSATAKVLEGNRIYGDGKYYYGPLVPALNAFGILLFGRKLIVLQAMGCIVYGLTAVVLWRIWKRFLPSLAAYLSVVASFLLAPFWFWEFHPWSSLYSLLFLAASLLYLLRWIEGHGLWGLALAGVLAALAFWSRQTVGLLLIIGEAIVLLIVVLARKEPRSKAPRVYIAWGLSVLVLLFTGLAILQMNHSVRRWFVDCFTSRATWAISISGTGGLRAVVLTVLTCLFDGLRCSLWTLLPLLLVISLIGALLGLLRDRPTDLDSRLSLTAFLVISAVSWLQYYPVADPRHHFWAALPFCAVPVMMVMRLLSARIPGANFKGPRKAIAMAARGLAVAAICAGVGYTYCVEVGQRFVTGVQLDPSLRLDPAGVRLTKYNRTFERPAVLTGMKGAQTQVEALSRLSARIAELTAAVPRVRLVCTSGWDFLAGAYADTKTRSNVVTADRALKPLLLGDDPRAPEGYVEAEHQVVSPMFAYQATNPGNYYLYKPKGN